jgi:hypothetical protein
MTSNPFTANGACVSDEPSKSSGSSRIPSTAGALLADLPSYCTSPPIEVVVFGWGVTEDGQLGLDSKEDVCRPSVVESLLGTTFSGFRFNRKPLVTGSRHTLAVTEDGHVMSWGWNDRGTLGLGHRCASLPTVAVTSAVGGNLNHNAVATYACRVPCSCFRDVEAWLQLAAGIQQQSQPSFALLNMSTSSRLQLEAGIAWLLL